MTTVPALKPVIWVGSSRQDLREFPNAVQDHMGYALYVAQRGGKHRYAKTLKGFGGAGVVEVVKDSRGVRRCGLCLARLPEEIEERTGDAAPGDRVDSASPTRRGADCKGERPMK